MAAADTELSLLDKGLSEVPLELAHTHASTATTVNLTENAIRPPGNLQLFTRMETLILDKNDLEGLAGFPRMESVRTLWFNNNRVADIVDFMDQVTELFPNLTYLSVMRNPASAPLVIMSEADAATSRRFRLYVIYRIPTLQFLDSSPVTAAERADAATQGPYLGVRKPKRAAASAGASTDSKDAASLFFGGAASTATSTDTGAAAAADDKKRSSAYLGLGTTYYDGRHSEGNRFINDRHL